MSKPKKIRRTGQKRTANIAVFLLLCALAASLGARPAQAAEPKRKFQKSRLTSEETEALADKRKVLLTTGEDRIVDLDFDVNFEVKGISIGNPGVVSATLARVGDKKQIVFKPLKEGETTVTLRDNEGTLRLIFTVRVTKSNLLRIAGEVRSLLRDVEGIEIRVVGPKVVIEGEVLVPSDYGRLLTVLGDKAYSEFVLNLAILSPLAMQVLAKRIQDDINVFAPNVKTRVVNSLIFLEGTVDKIDDAKRAQQVASFYLPDLRPGNPLERDQAVQRLPPRSLVQNFIVINPPPPKKQEKLVRVTVHFVQLSKDYNRLFGFKWEPGFSADPQISVGTNQTGTVGSGPFSFSGTISSLFPKLQSAQAAGYARILKTGTLVVRSGQAAKINETTDYPFTTTGANGQATANSRKVGLAIAVTPLILGQSEDIQLDLNMTQSNVVGKAATGSAPLVSDHSVETKLYVKSNESAAVAGVVASDIKTDFNKDDPSPRTWDNGGPLFTLKRTKNFDKQKSQFVIFVTPQIIENASDGTEDLKKNFRVRVK